MYIEKGFWSWVVIIFVLLVAVMALGAIFTVDESGNVLPAGSNSYSSEANSTENTNETLSNNQLEFASRNQVNIMSDVQNCYGDESCVTIVNNSSNSPQITDGDMSGGGVTRLCLDKDGGGFKTNKVCPEGYVTQPD